MWKSAVAAVVAALFLAAPVLAQTAPSSQSGKATPGDIAKMQRNNSVTGAGGINGDANGRGVNPFAVLDRSSVGQCWDTAAVGVAHNALCAGHDADGNGVISLDSYGGLGAKKLYFRINGTLIDVSSLGTGGGTSPAGTLLAFHDGGCIALHGGGCIALHGVSGIDTGSPPPVSATLTLHDGGCITLHGGGCIALHSF